MSHLLQRTDETLHESSPKPTNHNSTIPTLLLPTDHSIEEPVIFESDAGTATVGPPVVSKEEEHVNSGTNKVTEHPTTHGLLGYKAPGLFSQFRFKEYYFWLGVEPVSHQHLSSYLRGEKPEIAHHTAAWSTYTGRGLLYFDKKVENKGMPAGILNLCDAIDVTKQGALDFSFRLHNQKHTFQARSAAERDGWLFAVELAVRQALASKDIVVASEGYKNSMSQFGMPAVAAATVGTLGSTTHKKSSEGPRRKSSSSSNGRLGKRGMNKSKSRSVSRNNKRSSIFGGLLGKKEETDEKKEMLKEGKVEERAEKEELKQNENLDKEDANRLRDREVAPMVAPGLNGISMASSSPERGVGMFATPPHVDNTTSFMDIPSQVNGVSQSMQAALVVERVLAAPVVGQSIVGGAPFEDRAVPEPFLGHNTNVADSLTVKVNSTTRGTMNIPKNTKRTSAFGSFFQRVVSPSIEKKEHEVVPSVAPKDDVLMDAPANKPQTSQDQHVHNTINSEGQATTPATATPRPVGDRRRSSFFGLGSNSMKKDRSTAESEAVDGESPRTLKPSPPSRLGDLFRRPSKAPKVPEDEKREMAAPAAVPETENVTSGDDSLTNVHGVGHDGTTTGLRDEIRTVDDYTHYTHGHHHAIGTAYAGSPPNMESEFAVHAAA